MDSVALDVTYSGAEYDLLTPLGFANAVYHTLNLGPGEGCHSAPVCSTFVFMTLGPELLLRLWFFHICKLPLPKVTRFDA